MMRFLLFVALTLSTLGLANATVSAAELTGSTEAQSTDAKMPAGADFSNGPAGGGPPLHRTHHPPTRARLAHRPTRRGALGPPPPPPARPRPLTHRVSPAQQGRTGDR